MEYNGNHKQTSLSTEESEKKIIRFLATGGDRFCEGCALVRQILANRVHRLVHGADSGQSRLPAFLLRPIRYNFTVHRQADAIQRIVENEKKRKLKVHRRLSTDDTSASGHCFRRLRDYFPVQILMVFVGRTKRNNRGTEFAQ